MSRTPAAARRALVLGAVVALLASAVSVGAFLLGLRQVQERVDRASQRVTGEVVETDIGDDADIRVQWVDAAGREHEQRFGVYGEYDEGDSFEVRYDPDNPDGRAYPGDPEETDYEDGYYFGAVTAPALLLLLFGFLGLRVWWWRRALRRPAHQAGATALTGHFNFSTTTWLRLSRQHEQPRWQMVMWDSELDTIEGEVPVQVHGDWDSRRRLAVVLPSGTALIPQGRLRHSPPSSYDFEERAPSGRSLEEVLLMPEGATMPRPLPWWRAAAGWAAGGAALGLLLGSVVFSNSLWVGLGTAAGMAGLAVLVWTFNGAEQ